MIRFATLPIGLLIIAAGCSAPAAVSTDDPSPEEQTEGEGPTTGSDIALGDVFSLERGSSTVVDGLATTFNDVTEESRCPSGVECVWEGRATVSLSVTIDEITHPISVEIPGFVNADSEPRPGQSTEIGDYRLILLQLDPYPSASGSTANVVAVATLMITRG